MNVHEKRFSILDFARCAAEQENPWVSGMIQGTLEHLAGREAVEEMIALELNIIEDREKKLPPMEEVLLLMRPGHTRQEIKDFMAQTLPYNLRQLRRHPAYIEAETKLRNQP